MVLLRAAQASDSAGGLVAIWSEAPGGGAAPPPARDAAVLAVRRDLDAWGAATHRRRGPALRRGRDLVARRRGVGRRLVVGRRARPHGAAVEAIRGRRLVASATSARRSRPGRAPSRDGAHLEEPPCPRRLDRGAGRRRHRQRARRRLRRDRGGVVGAVADRRDPARVSRRLADACRVRRAPPPRSGASRRATAGRSSTRPTPPVHGRPPCQLDPVTAGTGRDVELFSPSDIATTWYRIVAGGAADVVVRRLR